MPALLAALVTALHVAYRSRNDPPALARARSLVAEAMAEIWYLIEGDV